MRIVHRSQTAIERSTQFVGDCIPGLLRMMMMMVLETKVMTAKMGMTMPSSGNTNSKGPCEVVVSKV